METLSELAARMLERRTRRVFVVTCNWPHYDAWCHEIGAHPRDPRLVRLTNFTQAQGQIEPFYRAVDWPDRFQHGLHAHEMMAVLRERRAISIEDADVAAWLAATSPARGGKIDA